MKVKVYVSALILIALTALKLLVPDEADRLRNIIMPEIMGKTDFRTQMLSLGSRLSGGDTVRVSEDNDVSKSPVDAKGGPLDISGDFVLADMVAENLIGFADTNTAAEDESSESALPPPADDEKRKKQAAFLEVQSAFSDYVIPAEVSYDIPVLPFEYACPADATVSSAFGYRVHPTHGDVRFHYGTDYALGDGEEIHAFAGGTIAAVQRFSGYGLTLVIDHGNGCSTLYAHCSQILVEAGDSVQLGQPVALAGHSGKVTGPHLHFELEINGLRYNPELCF
ncbi:MAG: M23 family metallopeptidase [Clostridiales bacterium]|nr:M23 family metallopeptidase [Clostridiales bacterium]